MILNRLTATLTHVAERVEGAVHARRERPCVASSEATLAMLALSPRTVIDFTEGEEAAIEAALSARLAARESVVR